MTKVIAVVNQKGGVAKTISTVHLGVAIAETGKKVLLVDLDSQGHIAEAFNVVADEIEYDMSDVFEGKKRIVDIIMPDVRTNLDVAPSGSRSIRTLPDLWTSGSNSKTAPGSTRGLVVVCVSNNSLVLRDIYQAVEKAKGLSLVVLPTEIMVFDREFPF
jgi:hypothetical protein